MNNPNDGNTQDPNAGGNGNQNPGGSTGDDDDDGDNHHHHEPTAGEVAPGKFTSLLQRVGQIPLSSALQGANQALSLIGAAASIAAFGLALIGVAPAVVGVLAAAAVVASVGTGVITAVQWARGDIGASEAVPSLAFSVVGAVGGMLGGVRNVGEITDTLTGLAFMESRTSSIASGVMTAGQLIGEYGTH